MKFWPIGLLGVLFFFGCQPGSSPAQGDDVLSARRRNMVQLAIRPKPITHEALLEAMRHIPRHLFLKVSQIDKAYHDISLPITSFTNTSAPSMVAETIVHLDPKRDEKILEIGTGIGYQAALLSELSKEVYTIEILAEVAARAEKTLKNLGFSNVHVRVGDGFKGWPEEAPFDAIIALITAKEPPPPLIDQLEVGGRLVMGIEKDGKGVLTKFTKTSLGVREEAIRDVAFDMMEGKAAGHALE